MKSKIFFSGLIIAGFFSLFALAKAQKPSAGMSGMPGINQEQMKKQQEQARQQQEQMKSQQDQMMAMMKKQNPKMYEQMKAAQEVEEKITQITTNFFAGKLSYESAKSQLRPLIMQQVKSRVDNIDLEVGQLQKRLEELKDIKNNPDKAADKEINMRLGKFYPEMPGKMPKVPKN